MCGLVGVAGNLELRDENLMKNLLWLDAFRGWDSTGMTAIRRTGEFVTAKTVGDPAYLFDTVRFRSALSASSSKVFLGHNRKATSGNISRINAHPFEYEHIVGAHNGGIDRSVVNELEKELGEKFSVDSMAIIAGIAKLGTKELISRLKGAWAIVYYNAADDTINFIRNDERPMWAAWSEDRRTLIWASETWMIEAAIENMLNGRKLWKSEKGNEIFVHEVDTHYKYSLDAMKDASKDKPLKPTVCKMPGAKKESSGNTYSWTPTNQNVIGSSNDDNVITGPFGQRGKPSETQMTMTIGTPPVHGETGGHPNDKQRVIELNTVKMHEPYCHLVGERQFELMTRNECAFCRNPIEFGDQGIQIFLRDNIVLCSGCSCSNHTQIHVETNLSDVLYINGSRSLNHA